MLQTRKPMSDEAINAMADRNERRRQIAKRAMGVKYAHHPANRVQRVDADPWKLDYQPYRVGMFDGYVLRGKQLFAVS